ncbi:hypothetical protein N7492_003443 [Penicillium capsulatum]|uniref:Wax synthase domain-containing protein n=1 Tax=Penicillium capsulatum TaxID=69766 RepID=A0A9W9LW84_9EURO|nr:hypothetical protein N7492_003443 [Penicillium capsulatum]KAJ6121974.1 hypothetical protein N7512_004439 [Penicillium capsulatum]
MQVLESLPPSDCLAPILSLLVSFIFTSLALNVSQGHRIYFLLPILVPAIISFLAINSLDLIFTGLGQLWGHSLIVYIVHNTSVLFLEQWVLHPDNEEAGRKWDHRAAYKIWGNPQLINTSREAPGAHKADPNISRITFVRNRAIQIICLCLVEKYVASRIFPGAFTPLSLWDFSPHRKVYLRRLPYFEVSTRETLLRSALAFRWIWLNFLGLHIAQTAVAILFSVILRWDEASEWPVLFGNPLDVWSLRRLWGKFWHRIVYRPYISWGLLLSRRLPGIGPGSSEEKAFVACFVFLLSGVSHALVTWRGFGCGYSGDILWFFMNSIATMLETAVIKMYQKSVTKSNQRGWLFLIHNYGLDKLGGFVWVFGFMFWSVPKWEYGKVWCVAHQI